jgi:Terminase large subunit, T4likevirus-type, N-terminal
VRSTGSRWGALEAILVAPEAFGGIARALDPAILMQDLGFAGDPWQCRALRSRSDRLLLLASRQSGKSTVTSCIALHQALYRPGTLTLLFAPSLRQSGELFLKVITAYRDLGCPVPATKELSLSLELENGSRIVTLPGDEATVRGFSAVSLAIVDEAARVSDALIPAIAPMLAVSRGRLLLLTTPFGRRGTFFDAWEGGDVSWERIRAVASECPRINPAFLEEQRRLLGPRYYAQEYESMFVDAEGQLFSSESIERVFCDTDNSLVIAGF